VSFSQKDKVNQVADFSSQPNSSASTRVDDLKTRPSLTEMPPVFPFSRAALPRVSTRKALLVLDLQNDFLTTGGMLQVAEPRDFVDKTLDFANRFREANAGDVIWVRTCFEEHRPASTDQIIITDELRNSLNRRSSSSRSRQRTAPSTVDDATTDDVEAFLSVEPNSETPPEEATIRAQCVLPNSTGSQLAPEVATAVDSARDYVFTKSHYSAFESNQLLMRLRFRFITELYICGSLTNISVYATALDAGRHGLAVTIIEDCCGFRSQTRHNAAIQSLVQLIGCETKIADDIATELSTMSDERARQAVPDEDLQRARRAGAQSLPLRNKEQPSSQMKSASSSELDASSTKTEEPKVTAAPTIGKSRSAPPGVSAAVGQGQVSADNEASTAPGSTEAQAHAESHVASRDVSSTANESSLAPSDPRDDTKGQTAADSTDSDSGTETSAAAKSEIRLQNKALAESGGQGDMTDNNMDTKDVGVAGQPAATEPLCEGDTVIFHNVLPRHIEDGIFERLRDEVQWLRMSHQGGEVPRLVCVQGEVNDQGHMPVYRHPADESPPLVPFTSTTDQIRKELEKILGHPLNHVLIQFYRSGNDYISEHSDKTLDIVKGSYICNVSLGAERTMVFRTKRADKDPSRNSVSPGNVKDGNDRKEDAGAGVDEYGNQLKRRIVRAKLPHNSLCRMGLKTNERWLHAIRQDKRQDWEKSEPELAFAGGRISLTFRQIGTFLNRDNTLIWGQGATKNSSEDASAVINGQSSEAVEMLKAFGVENHSSSFDWDKFYGAGFDVLHISNAPRFFTSADPIVNMRIQLMLAEHSISYAKGSMSPSFNWKDGKTESTDKEAPPVPENLPVKFVDNDLGKSSVQGDMAILLYLDAVYGGADKATSRPQIAREMTRFQMAMSMLDKWRGSRGAAREHNVEQRGDKSSLLKPLRRELAIWDAFAKETPSSDFIAGGGTPSAVDFALWPVLYDMETWCGGEEGFVKELKGLGSSGLALYYQAFKGREGVQKVIQG